MINSQQISQLVQRLESVGQSLVIIGPDANFDQIAAALSLYRGLNALSKGARIASTQKISGLDKLISYQDINSELGNESLTITFDYSEEKVDKISYHISEETNKFLLTIKPQDGSVPLDPNAVAFNKTGASYDIIFLLNVSDLGSLEQLYFGYEDLYRNGFVVSIGSFQPDFAQLHLDIGDSATVSEQIFFLLKQFGANLDPDTATNLLAGIEHSTERFQSKSATAETFAAVSELLKLGARRGVIVAETSIKIESPNKPKPNKKKAKVSNNQL